ncbi:MAG: tRNA (cytidine(34)-2'-O)-methyltransferase [Alphaproteobacteria bacterium]|nr:tRNA (cytidine(34)-2'-O)-methyltransferase [Alphaproteobacteria bacterium]
MLRIALYQPDIPQNTGALLRLGACLGTPVDIIGPCGFVITDRGLRRAGMDYLDMAVMQRHDSWPAFLDALTARQGRLILLTTTATQAYSEFHYAPGDTLLLGRESAGAPEEVHARADARLRIPMLKGRRSLNMALCAAMALGEALRQVNGFPVLSEGAA